MGGSQVEVPALTGWKLAAVTAAERTSSACRKVSLNVKFYVKLGIASHRIATSNEYLDRSGHTNVAFFTSFKLGCVFVWGISAQTGSDMLIVQS